MQLDMVDGNMAGVGAQTGIKIDGLVLSASRIHRGSISLNVPHGEVYALLGEAGSGKTALVRTLIGLVPAIAGDVRIEGYPPGSMEARRAMTVVSGHCTLCPAMTALQNVK